MNTTVIFNIEQSLEIAVAAEEQRDRFPPSFSFQTIIFSNPTHLHNFLIQCKNG